MLDYNPKSECRQTPDLCLRSSSCIFILWAAEIPKSRVFIAEDTLIKSNGTDKALENVKPVLPDKNVTIILPPPVDANNPGKFEDLHKQSLEEALPFLLDQYAIPHDKVRALTDNGVPVLNDALLALLSGDSNSTDP